ncbi:MAG: ATP-binding protein [Bacteroidales bacterium]|nr:ATP-binding protein [Bacteroidales bacterium]
MIKRKITERLLYYSSKYPVLTITGPRQSGKSTLMRSTFPDYNYISLEDPDVLLMIKDDARLFLKNYPNKTIIDEAQRYPEIFSYLQGHVDSASENGMYILSGSHNFLLMEGVSQTLAGRTAIFKLLPLSYQEITKSDIHFQNIDELIYTGMYPRIYGKKLEPQDFYPFYIQTYLEKDIRLIKNITDLSMFVRFIKLCAGRIGQLLNLSSISIECGISQPTAKAWLSALESSYIIYLLKPHHKNYNKRLVKTPKLYFYDTGLACTLLGLENAKQLSTHYLRGELFENFIITEYVKSAFNNVKEPNIYFWRDNIGNEVDLIIDDSIKLKGVEIKSGATFKEDFFKGINYWEKLSKTTDNTVVYGGDVSMETKHGKLISWKDWAEQLS